MSRKITQKEIDSLEIWNKTPGRKYVSVEEYQDMLDWMPSQVSAESMSRIYRCFVVYF